MEISFKGPVMPIDPYSQLAFVEILNIILIAKHIMDVNRYLIARNVNPQFGSLSGYFRWSFADERFTLWQRTYYNSDMCFSHRILDMPTKATVFHTIKNTAAKYGELTAVL